MAPASPRGAWLPIDRMITPLP